VIKQDLCEWSKNKRHRIKLTRRGGL